MNIIGYFYHGFFFFFFLVMFGSLQYIFPGRIKPISTTDQQITKTMAGTLNITDSRTNAQHQIPIQHNAILASDLKKTTGLRVHDPGLQNTTVVETGITVSYAFFPRTRDLDELTA